jgi:hypothetical protein
MQKKAGGKFTCFLTTIPGIKKEGGRQGEDVVACILPNRYMITRLAVPFFLFPFLQKSLPVVRPP